MRNSRAKSLALFDLELDEAEGPGGSTAASEVLQDLLLLEDQTAHDKAAGPQAKLTHDAQEAHALALSPSGEVSLERFAQLLAVRGHNVWLRTGRLDCCDGQVALRHSFVLAGIQGAADSPASKQRDPSALQLPQQLFVVDPCFKEQFALPNATPQYQTLWQQLPDLYVGTAEQLVPIVELMCTQMQQVFADTATSCPPWRTPSCMLTKWLPSAADDVPVPAPGDSSSSQGSDRSRPSSSNTNSALSSPAGGGLPSTTSIGGLLAPIRTAAAATPRQHAAGDAVGPDGYAAGGLTPRSARSPLYYDQEDAFAVRKGALLAFSSPDDHACAEHQHHTGYSPAATAQQALLAQWSSAQQQQQQHQQAGVTAAAAAQGGDGGLMLGGDASCFMAAAAAASGGCSWGFGSTMSSPGCDMPWCLLRNCRSEDGGGAAAAAAHSMMMPDAPRAAHGVAIARRSDGSKVLDQDDHPAGSSSGFAEALALAGAAAAAATPVFAPPPARRASLDMPVPSAAGRGMRSATGATAPSAMMTATTSTTGVRQQGAHRSFTGAVNPTLDISRFDRNSVDDVLPAGPLAWLAAERFGSTCSISSTRKAASSSSSNKPSAGAGAAVCPAAVRRRSAGSSSSQCSALSAAIAGKGVPMR